MPVARADAGRSPVDDDPRAIDVVAAHRDPRVGPSALHDGDDLGRALGRHVAIDLRLAIRARGEPDADVAEQRGDRAARRQRDLAIEDLEPRAAHRDDVLAPARRRSRPTRRRRTGSRRRRPRRPTWSRRRAARAPSARRRPSARASARRACRRCLTPCRRAATPASSALPAATVIARGQRDPSERRVAAERDDRVRPVASDSRAASPDEADHRGAAPP